MANVFISHSSQDKPFVRRLATALLSEGFPVWLDSWKLEIGDSLLDRIYDGIDQSSMVLLVMSQSAIASGWVNKELNAALAREGQLGRKFLIPIRTDAGEIPLKVADRLYADFSDSFSQPLSTLVKALVSAGCRDLQVPADRELLGLSFTNEVHLDTASMQRGYGHVRRRHPHLVLHPEQVLVNDDPEFEALVRKMHRNIDKVGTSQFYSESLENDLRSSAQYIDAMQDHLRTGVAEMLNHGIDPLAIYWFAKIVRGRAVYTLWSKQLADDPERIGYGAAWQNAEFGNGFSVADFFETERVWTVDIWRRSRADDGHFHLWIDAEEGRKLLSDDEAYEGPLQFYAALGWAAAVKYVFPQMVLKSLRFPEEAGEPIWDLTEAMVGIH